MNNQPSDNESPKDSNAPKSLEDQILKYDMKGMIDELQNEFDAGVYSQELVSQNDISLHFNLKQKKLDLHARN
ncbi:hypothetical protein MLD52_15605 [Puniceicoccaceae bacterium K14]|nr:hypothetical protein [Puniceicoccaceae bacterium K14]